MRFSVLLSFLLSAWGVTLPLASFGAASSSSGFLVTRVDITNTVNALATTNGLTNLNAANVLSGKLPPARVSDSSFTNISLLYSNSFGKFQPFRWDVTTLGDRPTLYDKSNDIVMEFRYSGVQPSGSDEGTYNDVIYFGPKDAYAFTLKGTSNGRNPRVTWIYNDEFQVWRLRPTNMVIDPGNSGVDQYRIFGHDQAGAFAHETFFGDDQLTNNIHGETVYMRTAKTRIGKTAERGRLQVYSLADAQWLDSLYDDGDSVLDIGPGWPIVRTPTLIATNTVTQVQSVQTFAREFIALNPTDNSNLVMNLNVRTRDLAITNNLSVTNFIGYSDGEQKDVCWRILPTDDNHTLVLPLPGTAKFGVRLFTNANNTISGTNTLTLGKYYLLSVSAWNTNFHVTLTEWQ